MKGDFIEIVGAKIHNLKNISLKIPKNKLVVICGLSGSGKSSLAFDTIYAEGQRRYLESLSSYARQFLGGYKKPEVEKIEGLSPTIAINQRTISSNPRSTVGTITEIYDYLRLLFARVGTPYCPNCNIPIKSQTSSEIAKKVFDLLISYSKIRILAPVIFRKKGEHRGVIEQIVRSGWPKIRIDGVTYSAEEASSLDLEKGKKHTIEVVVEEISSHVLESKVSLIKSLSKREREALKKRKKRLKIALEEERLRVLEGVKRALEIGKGVVKVEVESKEKKREEFIFSTLFSCPKCGFSLPKIEPRLFSFNSPYGACPYCQGLGKRMEVEESLIVNPELSIGEGAIFPLEKLSLFGKRKAGISYLKWKIKEVLEGGGYSFSTPFKEIDRKTQEKILYGDVDFEGIIPRLERIYYQTESDFVRAEIGKYLVEKPCPVCKGARLKKEALAVKIGGKNIYEVSLLPIDELINFLEGQAYSSLSEKSKEIARPIIKEIIERGRFLVEVGLSYLTLARSAESLSVGENQRLRLAYQLGSRLSGIIYVLDEPTIGLHQRDIDRLVKALKKLRDLHNSIIVVEHDKRVIEEADWIIEIGPKAGEEGGKIIFEGPLSKFKRSKTITALYLAEKLSVNSKEENAAREYKLSKRLNYLEIKKASQFNLKNVNLKIPLKKFVVVCGVSGSGKSTLIIEVLAKALMKELNYQRVVPGKYQELLGLEYLDKVVLVDQSPIGRTPRSNPATYTGVFTFIRELYAKLPESKIRGYTSSHFSFNTPAGRCEACKGEGYKKIEMYFLPDIYVECEVCRGKRYKPEILEVKYKEKSIADVLDMSVKEALKFFREFPPIKERLSLLSEIGLDYLKLGQPATTLSGGEAQRIKLAHELSKRNTGRTIYILDEPTVGLHFEDIRRLLLVLRKLQEKGNTIVVIEHNPDVIKEADWIVELGPEGGEKGGKIIFEGTLKELKKAKTPTAKFLL